MELITDGEREVVDAQGGKSLGKVLDEERVRVRSEGRVITGIRVDGEVLERERQDELGARSVGEFERVEITTRNADELARETLRELVEHVGQVERVIPELVGHLEAEEIQKAMALLAACCQMWAVVQEALSKVGLVLDWDYGEVEVEGRSVGEWLGEMEGTLREMNEALTNRDYFMLGEVLSHEFSPAMGAWQRILKQLAENA